MVVERGTLFFYFSLCFLLLLLFVFFIFRVLYFENKFWWILPHHLLLSPPLSHRSFLHPGPSGTFLSSVCELLGLITVAYLSLHWGCMYCNSGYPSPSNHPLPIAPLLSCKEMMTSPNLYRFWPQWQRAHAYNSLVNIQETAVHSSCTSPSSPILFCLVWHALSLGGYSKDAPCRAECVTITYPPVIYSFSKTRAPPQPQDLQGCPVMAPSDMRCSPVSKMVGMQNESLQYGHIQHKISNMKKTEGLPT